MPSTANQPRPSFSCHLHMGKLALHFAENGHAMGVTIIVRIAFLATTPTTPLPMGSRSQFNHRLSNGSARQADLRELLALIRNEVDENLQCIANGYCPVLFP